MNEYQSAAMETAVYPDRARVTYPALLLASEAGEVAGKLSKVQRGDKSLADPDVRAAIVDEMGDVLWALAALARDLGVTFEAVGMRNIEKLADRARRGVIRGDGDRR